MPNENDTIESLRARLAEVERERKVLDEWRSTILSVVEATIPEYTSGAWAGDKRGWGFVHEMIRFASSERSREKARADAAESALAAAREREMEAIEVAATSLEVAASGLRMPLLHRNDAIRQADYLDSQARSLRALSSTPTPPAPTVGTCGYFIGGDFDDVCTNPLPCPVHGARKDGEG